MQSHVSIVLVAAAFATTVAALSGPAGQAQSQPNASGDVRTLALNGTIDRRNPFFRPIGKQFATTCEHCHFASDAWGVSAEHVRQLFNNWNCSPFADIVLVGVGQAATY